jgi:hypothetical protein
VKKVKKVNELCEAVLDERRRKTRTAERRNGKGMQLVTFMLLIRESMIEISWQLKQEL